jgi:azurin
MRALPAVVAALLLALALPAPAGAADTCEYVRSSQVNTLDASIVYVDQKCRWYDLNLKAHVTERVERVEAHRGDGEAPDHVFTYYKQALERRFADGTSTYLHRTYVLSGGAFVQHDYLEKRDASGRVTCGGAGEVDPPAIPGRVSATSTPPYPACAPPGLLA